jgi:hypothetical protein
MPVLAMQYVHRRFQMSEFLVVEGKQIPFVRKRLPVSKLQLDPGNPRIQYLLGQSAGGLNQAELDALIWEKDAVKALAGSIYQNGGVYEPIVVQNRKKDTFVVREGNCRTVACRHLLEQYPKDPKFSSVPAMVFAHELTEEALAVLLADMHVAGKIRWDAYEQAKHVHDLAELYGKTYEWLSNHLRLSKSRITELLAAYKAVNDFLKSHPSPENLRKFSVFHELMKKKELRQVYSQDPGFRKRFHGWVAGSKLSEAIQVRNLPAILANVEAGEALDRHGIEEANRVLIRDDPALESDLFKAIKHATARLRAAPANDVQDLKAKNRQKIAMVRALQRALQDLADLSGLKL